MKTIHLATPAAPRVAACGAVPTPATHFTFWRWQATCRECVLITAARQMDAQTAADVLYKADIPVRYSALVAYVRKYATLPNVELAIAEFERDRVTAALCKKHGLLADPIALFDVKANRMMFACPECTTGPTRDRWEREGRGA